MTKAVLVKKARKANKEYGIKKGDRYWFWSTRSNGKFVKHYSKTEPTRQQLTQSEYQKSLYDLEDSLADLITRIRTNKLGFSYDEIDGEVEDLITGLEDLGSEQREKKENMPESLQDSDTGQLLEERADGCDATAEAFREALREIEGSTEEAGNQSWAEKAADALEAVSWET